MADTAAHLVDRVFPEVPIRQWVLSLPFALRYRLAYDAHLVRDVLHIVVCGLCGSRMNVHYNIRRNGIMMTNYVCAGRTRLFGDPLCQSILGTGIDAVVGKLLVEAVTPMALELALAVRQEIAARLDEADRLRRRQVERAQYEADIARHRYMQVDPANRLVADVLEADWNARLRAFAGAQEEYQRRRAAGTASLSTMPSGNASWLWPRIFRPYGTIPKRRSASASACSGS
jgi:hypothetical protein